MATVQEHLAGGLRTVTGRWQEDLCSKKTYIEEMLPGSERMQRFSFVIRTGDRAGLNF